MEEQRKGKMIKRTRKKYIESTIFRSISSENDTEKILTCRIHKEMQYLIRGGPFEIRSLESETFIDTSR